MKKRYIIGGCIAAAIAGGVFAARPALVALPDHCWNGFLRCDTQDEKAFLHGLDVIQHNFDVLRSGRLAAATTACMARNGFIDDGQPIGTNGDPRFEAYWTAADKCTGGAK